MLDIMEDNAEHTAAKRHLFLIVPDPIAPFFASVLTALSSATTYLCFDKNVRSSPPVVPDLFVVLLLCYCARGFYASVQTYQILEVLVVGLKVGASPLFR